MQWNARSINNKLGTLCNLIDVNKIDVVLLSETYLDDGKNLNIYDFNVIRKDRDSRGGGVAIALRKKYTYRKISMNYQINGIEAIAIRIILSNSFSLDVVSVYIPPSIRISAAQVDKIFCSLETPFVIGGDLNAHAMDWGCFNNSPRGDLILDALDRHMAVFLNDGTFTRLQPPPLVSSAIDLTITDSNTALNCEWKVLDGSYGSDHNPIVTQFTLGMNVTINTNKIIISTKKMKALLRDENYLEQKLNNVHRFEDFREFLLDVRKQSEIVIPAQFVRTRKPWWDENCNRAMSKCIRFNKIFHKMGTRENYERKIEAEKELKKVKKIARREGWKNYCSNITRETKFTEIWKMAKVFKNSGKVVTNDTHDDWMEKFMNKKSPPNPLNNIDKMLMEIKFNEPLKPITVHEVTEKIKNLKKSAAGLDEINNNVLKLLPFCAVEKLTHCFNEILITSIIPEDWKECRVIAIPKPNRTINDENSRRPISIFNKIRRIFESILVRKYERWNEGKISNSQYGFRKGKGVRDSIAILTADIKIAFNEKKIVAAVLLDVESAYDNINIECYIKKLISLGASKNYCTLMWSLMKTKVNNFEMNGKIVGKRISHTGLAQGLPLSCSAYNLCTHEIQKCIDNGVKILEFADDTILYYVTKDIKEAEVKLNDGIKKLEECVKEIGLNYSDIKSEAIVFSRKHQDTKISILINNKIIPQKEQVRYLGIILDRKLLMTQHINKISAIAGKATNIMRAMAGVSWGSDPRCLELLYKGCVRSKIEFCPFVYPENKKINKLEKIQWKACRIIGGCMNSTPTNALEVITGITPLRLRFEKLNYKFFCFIKSQPRHTLNKNLQKLKNMGVNFMNFETPNNLKKYEFFPFSSPNDWENVIKTNTKIHESINCKDDVNDQIVQMLFQELVCSRYESFEIIYTDGSKKESSTSASFCQIKLEKCVEKKYKLNDNISVFTAECFAIGASLDYMGKMPIHNLCIVTDSLSAIKALKNAKNSFKTHHMVAHLCEKINRMSSNGIRVELVWVPSHCGVMGNERADKLANEAHENPDESKLEKFNFKEKSDQRFKTKTCIKWQEEWSASDKGRFCFSIVPRISSRAWFKSADFSRKEIVFWNRIITNHSRCASSLNRFKIVDTPLCPCGKNYESVDHIVFECDLTSDSDMKQKLRNIGFHPPWCIRDIIAIEIQNSEKNAMKIISSTMAHKLIELKKI